MPRYAFKISYNGAAFAGFQWQEDQPSVQGAIEAALRKLEPECGRIIAAGRTDAGVHALGQVVHADLEREWEPYRLSEALNYHLRPDLVACLAVSRVDEAFSARFSAIQRHYRYRIISRKAPLTLMEGRAWRIKKPLDVEAMNEAAQIFVGKHDFTTFRSASCQSRSPVKTIDHFNVSLEAGLEGEEVHLCVKARSFLHNQVRSFVGTLERVGIGVWSISEVKDSLEACARERCGPVAPPDGLYLEDVIYDKPIFETKKVGIGDAQNIKK